ncbi:DUF4286 family protein [Chelativorans sp. Marseille-P2723]|uniref:DUF4286 family protein n=1 Tax=Chelativorans sp. Marseille-P2723 TaxID=2709133 RepID=UPI00156DEB6E|nr:DUF4286 family protein [Chelativorans sp. Marseille-P2723]
MERHLMVVMTNPVEGREEEYNEWYDNQHLADVLKIPGIVSAERFELSASQRSDPPYPFSYLALYWIETDDLARVVGELKNRSGTSLMPLSEAMAADRSVYLFKPRTR